MNILDCIAQDYKTYVQNAKINTELKRALKTQERIPLFFSNLAHSLRSKENLTRDEIRIATYDLTQVFIDSVEKKAKEDYLSDIAKQELKEKAKKQEKLNELKNKVVQKTGEFEYDGSEL